MSDDRADVPALFLNRVEEVPPDSALAHVLRDEETPEERAELARDRGNAFFRAAMRVARQTREAPADEAVKELTPVERQDRVQALLRQAAEWYTQGLEVGCAERAVNAALYVNRATVHIQRGNYGRALQDARRCLERWDDAYVKAYQRAAYAAMQLSRYAEAMRWCEAGLALAPGRGAAAGSDAQALQTLREQIQQRQRAEQQRQQRMYDARWRTQQEQRRLLAALQERGVRIGAPLFAQQRRYPTTMPRWAVDDGDDGASSLLWPLLVVYPEHDQSDYLEAVHEATSLHEVLQWLLPPPGAPALPWDRADLYRPDQVCAWYATQWTRTADDTDTFVGSTLPPDAIGEWRPVPLEPHQATDAGSGGSGWSLGALLRQPDYTVPLFPVLLIAPIPCPPRPGWLLAHRS
ncbi:hypothetical protein CDCA_CDCA03G0857 [Cyanidium caldarium]|uniref:Cns1/TTC4 wheel domain-containing protein n=1 Tax=Cyanidium caldarium TaxID=2771 RepID=A0AAV9IRG0_CYACA|nr:hypothetical protein CDCA_CDCA03G0857 [Cyanidium caldarium]